MKISLERINQYLGTSLVVKEVNEIFEALGFSYEEKDHVYSVVVPPRRWDIQIEADIIEEVARIYGYDPVAIYSSKWRNGCWKLVKRTRNYS